jgi:hypothetical protein
MYITRQLEFGQRLENDSMARALANGGAKADPSQAGLGILIRHNRQYTTAAVERLRRPALRVVVTAWL